MRNKAFCAAALAVLLAAACGEDPLDVGNRSLDGRWDGSVRVGTAPDTARLEFLFDLEQDGRDVSGTAGIEGPEETVDAAVDGEWDYPNVVLRISAPEYADLVFRGAFGNASPDSVGGTLTGSGFSGATFFILRQSAQD